MKHKFSMTWCGWIIERRRRNSNEIQIVHWYTRECTSSTFPKQHNNTHFFFVEEEMNIPCRISFETRGSKLGVVVWWWSSSSWDRGGSERECSIRRDVCDDEDGFLSSCELKLNWKRGKIYDELMWAKSRNWSLLFTQLESLFPSPLYAIWATSKRRWDFSILGRSARSSSLGEMTQLAVL